MKNYSIKANSNANATYIIDFEYINDYDIQIYMGDGRDIIVPCTQSNLQKIRTTMKEQAKKASELLPSKKNKLKGYTALTVAGVVGIVIVNTTSFGKELGPILPNATLGGISLMTAVGAIKNNRLIEDIRKLNLFVKREKEINEAIINNSYVYANIDEKDLKKLSESLDDRSKQPIEIEDLNEISYKTLNTIWNNIVVSKQLGLSYEKPTAGYQKTKI